MTKKPVPVLRRELEASELLRESNHKHELPIAVLEVEALGQIHTSLGEYTIDKPPIGFSTVVTPDCEPDDVIVQITRLSAAYDEFELFLHVANYHNKAVVVEVFRLLSGDSEVSVEAEK